MSKKTFAISDALWQRLKRRIPVHFKGRESIWLEHHLLDWMNSPNGVNVSAQLALQCARENKTEVNSILHLAESECPALIMYDFDIDYFCTFPTTPRTDRIIISYKHAGYYYFFCKYKHPQADIFEACDSLGYTERELLATGIEYDDVVNRILQLKHNLPIFRADFDMLFRAKKLQIKYELHDTYTDF